MLRVLTLSTLFPDAARPRFGGFVARQTVELAARADVQVKVVAPVGVAPFPLDRLARFRRFGAVPVRETWDGLDVLRPRFLALPGVGGRTHPALLARALRPVLDRLREEFAFDVIDAEFFFPDGPAAVALGRRYGVPVSIKARGSDVHHWGRAPATAAAVARAARDAEGLLAVSAAMADDVAALGGRRPLVHHTGVDLDRFRPVDRAAAKAAIGVTGPLVVSAGTLDANKGHAIVADAVAQVPGATLIVAGDGPERGALEQRAAASDGRIRVLGSVSHDELAHLLAAADVFALASAHEGLANVWVEALACGTPLVITDVGGAREVVTAPAYGRIVAREAAALAAGIAEVLAEAPGAQLVRAGAERFSWSANTAALHAHLLGLVSRHSRAGGNPLPLSHVAARGASGSPPSRG